MTKKRKETAASEWRSIPASARRNALRLIADERAIWRHYMADNEQAREYVFGLNVAIAVLKEAARKGKR